jgi:ATP-dependent DNA helicase RecQ
MKRALDGRYDIMYIALERFNDSTFVCLAQQLNLPLVAVDEAHCVKSVGAGLPPHLSPHKGFVDTLLHRPICVALTATATPRVCRRIS